MKNKKLIPWKMILRCFVIFTILACTSSLLFAFVPQKVKKTVPASADKEKNPIPADAASIAAGKKIFQFKCTSCHGSKGKGNGAKIGEFDEKPRDFTQADFQKQSDGAIYWEITIGDRDPMPCFKTQMTTTQRWQVINYVRTLK
jgi:mono/diheme cytochrome c family protein